MEQIIYRLTLDTHKSGVQRTLQGFETADKMARRIAINLTSCGDTYEIPYGVMALMYVKPSGIKAISINECTIDGNTIIYDALPFNAEDIYEMQIKLIETSVDGARKVIVSPKFAIEVAESGTDDEVAEQTPTFTALEQATALANAVYNERLLGIEIDNHFIFRATYADGTVYENDAIKEAIASGHSTMAKSWAIGGTGARDGEDTNNAMYYSNIAKSSSHSATRSEKNIEELVEEAQMYSAYTIFEIDFESGNLTYLSRNYSFDIDEKTGDLIIDGGDDYTPEQMIGRVVNDMLDETNKAIAVERARIDSFTSLPSGSTTGDAELIDARVDNNGTTHANVGEHIRKVTDLIDNKIAIQTNIEWEQGRISSVGTLASSDYACRSQMIFAKKGSTIKVENGNAKIYKYSDFNTEESTFIGAEVVANGYAEITTDTYIRITYYINAESNGTKVTTSEAKQNVIENIYSYDLNDIKESTVLTFPTLAEAKNSVLLAEGSIIRTLGYTTAFDGGGNEYIVSAFTGINNGGSHISTQLNKYTLIGKFPTGVNIRQWGCSTDLESNSTPFQRALNYCRENGKTLIVNGDGQYVFKNGIAITSGDRYSIQGEALKGNWGRTQLGAYNLKFQNTAFYCSAGTDNKIALDIRNLSVVFTDEENNKVNDNEMFKNVILTGSRIDNCIIESAGYFLIGGLAENTVISNCLIHNIGVNFLKSHHDSVTYPVADSRIVNSRISGRASRLPSVFSISTDYDMYMENCFFDYFKYICGSKNMRSIGMYVGCTFNRLFRIGHNFMATFNGCVFEFFRKTETAFDGYHDTEMANGEWGAFVFDDGICHDVNVVGCKFKDNDVDIGIATDCYNVKFIGNNYDNKDNSGYRAYVYTDKGYSNTYVDLLDDIEVDTLPVPNFKGQKVWTKDGLYIATPNKVFKKVL